MSNAEADPGEFECAASVAHSAVQVVAARAVPLGGARAITVHRTLPTRDRTLVGAWCFADHYGPTDPASDAGMNLPPHPHTGLQTVSWLFAGEIEHRDSIGSLQTIRPGEVNLMTSGRGISHSEVAEPGAVLHGAQLWIALPSAARDGAPDFEHFAASPVTADDATVRVFLGEALGSVSPVRTYTPLLGAEVVLKPGGRLRLPVQESFEHGVLVDQGPVELDGTPLQRSELGCIGAGRNELVLTNVAATAARVLVLGGEPFDEELVMWWNFVARSHDEIEQFRAQWQARSERFGTVNGYAGKPDWLPAPELPKTRIKPRRNPPSH